jgi:hypothetical protein
MNTYDFDIEITKTRGRKSMGGTWVIGAVNTRYRFDALVFAEHAENESYELDQSRISRLAIIDADTKKLVFNFDRGLDVPPANAETQAVVEFICEGLADLIHG